MGKSIRSNLPISFSTIPFQNFPAELLFITFQDLDIPTLLKVCNACKRFQQIATEILSKKFNEPGVELRMTFEQEYKFIFNVPFTFSKFNRKNGNFIFKPKSSDSMEYLRFVHSPMVKSPDLSKVFITIPNNDTSITNNDSTTTTTTTTSNSSPPPSSSLSNSSKKNNNKQLKKNFLEKPLILNIKSNESSLKEIRYVYRVGHGTTHLKIPYVFKYEVTDKPPPSMQNTRGGERWLKPISFECAPSFFYPSEPIAYKIFMKIRYLGKRNSHKKSSSSPSSPSSQIQDRKQKQKDNIGFKEVEDFISIEVAHQEGTSCNEQQQQQQQQQSMNQNLRVQVHLKGNLTTRWLKGARR